MEGVGCRGGAATLLTVPYILLATLSSTVTKVTPSQPNYYLCQGVVDGVRQ